MEETTMTITMNHGAGGRIMHEFIHASILAHLGNDLLLRMDDAAVLEPSGPCKIAMTTDSYVVHPLFFPGGDIGKLAICGTVNDLSTSGAIPRWLTLSFILEEGFPLESLDRIIASIGATAREAGVLIVTGDTKVVEKGKGDGIFINTAGVGFIPEGVNLSTHNARPGDSVLINGPMGNHEAALFTVREQLPFTTTIESDAAPLNHLVQKLLGLSSGIRSVKDPTRGGVASALWEICDHSSVTITVQEDALPVDPQVRGVCELVGFDPMYMANEGKIIVVCDSDHKEVLLAAMGPGASCIGTVCEGAPSLTMATSIGGIRRLSMMENIQLPRIC
ncbi:hydrogenase expression/formation protein HypE [Myxococcota bacterium]|nr:hydrogenase expression/formation protein HypE [Myxococcota bacterium]MBU1536498.1 hydrogenase expression/formation protein HypE [Myxococcota bacterium]